MAQSRYDHPMGRRTDTREKMLTASSRLFTEQGFEATGLLQIIEESGTPRGSIYFHFPGGKEQLGVEAVELSTLGTVAAVTKAIQRGGSTAEAVRLAARALAASLEQSDFQLGCPVATIALETASSSPKLRQACEEFFASWRALYRRSLLAEQRSVEEAEALSTLIVAAIEGALLLARTSRVAAPLLRVGEQLAALLDGGPSA